MGRIDGFQALLDRAAANTIAVSPPVDRIFRPMPDRKENLGRNQPLVVSTAGSLLAGGEADTSSFGAPGHDAPGQWTEDRRKLGRIDRRNSFDWKEEARNRGRSMAPPSGLRHRETGGESPASTTSRSSSSYSRIHAKQSHYPSESLYLRYSDNIERFHSPRASDDDGRTANPRSFQEFIRSRAEYDGGNRGEEQASDRNRPDYVQRAQATPPPSQQQQWQFVLTEADWKLREAELEVAQQRKEQELAAKIESFKRYRQEEADKLDAEYRALNGMQQDVDKRIAMLREVEAELHEREHTLGEEQKATGDAISDLENQAESWERQKQQRAQELAKLEAQSQEEQRKLLRLQKQVGNLEREVKDKQSALHDELRTIRMEIGSAEEEKRTAESQLRSIHLALERVQAQVDQGQLEVDQKSQRVSEAEQKLTVVIGQLEVAQRQKLSMDNDLARTQQRHTELKGEVSDMECHLQTEEERWHRTVAELKEARSKLEAERRGFRNQMNKELDEHHHALTEERRKNDEHIAQERKVHDERLAKERDEAKASVQEQEQILEAAKRRHAEQSSNFQERRRRAEKDLQDERRKLDQERKALESERDQLRMSAQSLDQQNRETEERFNAAISEERRQTNKLRQELEEFSRENKLLRHELAQAQQKAMSNQQRLKEYSTRLEKQAAILESKSATLQKDRERLERWTQEMNRKEVVFQEEQQKYALMALLRHQADKKACLKAVFSKWVSITHHKDEEEKLQQYERREYRLKQEYQSRLRESRDKEKELYEEIHALKSNEANLRERERVVLQGNDRIRQLAQQLHDRDMKLRARETALMGPWTFSSEDDGTSTIGGSSISTSPAIS